VGYETRGSELASYFLPSCKNCLVTTEDLTNQGADLLSSNFNIFTQGGDGLTADAPFESRTGFSAQQSTIGLGLHYKQGFCFNDDRTKWWYIDTNTPITHVKNTVILKETVIQTGGGVDTTASPNAVANMTQAFNQSDWCFGKINSCAHTKTGLADIELKFGRQLMWYEEFNAAIYVGVLIPTGNKPNAHYVFEPIIGHGKHAGIMWGAEGGAQLWANCDNTWQLMLECDANAQYLFKNKQTRSFDLKLKPWSRYLAVYANQAQAAEADALVTTAPEQSFFLATPGINIFTQQVDVKPGFSCNATSALIVTSDCGFQGEAGYNFFARQAECVMLTCSWQQGPAIKALGGQGATNPYRNITPNTASNSGLNDVLLTAYNTSLIQASDLDLQSAAHPCIISHTLYGSAGYKWNVFCLPIDFNIGGSYEFAGKTFAVMKRWTLWGKFGLAF